MTGPGLPRVLLVGAGAMGTHHGRVISESSSCALAAVVDPMEDRGRGLALRFGVDWKPEVENLAAVDAVVVACSTDQHRRIALDVLAQDIPLFVEKPLCADLRHSREIVDTALRRGVPLMCGFVERFNPAVLAALARVESPLAVRTQRHSSQAVRMRTGVTWDLLVHDIDIAVRLFADEGPKVVQSVTGYSVGERGTGEDTVETELEFSESRVAALSASRVAARRARELMISDENRTIVADLLNPSVAIYSGPDRLETVECAERRDPLTAQLDRFIGLVNDECEAAAETHSILPSHEAVAAILDSAAESALECANTSLQQGS